MESNAQYKEQPNIDAAIDEFIVSWGNVSTNWGINKTMGQIHALLLVSVEPLCTDDIMQKLDLSRGNIHSNIQSLLEWELIYKQNADQDRKDYFVAEKDMWKLFSKVLQHRKDKELKPMMDLVNDSRDFNPTCIKSKEFSQLLNEISMFSQRVDQMLNTVMKADSIWGLNSFIKMVR
jgi:DNA-binding transcriptional regulator GbsR (MarR family)